jgi:DNA-binding transcriptional ArsR family regulator
MARQGLTAGSLLHNLSVMKPHGYGRASPDHLNTTFAALADPTRRAILSRLASGEASVIELAEPFAMSQPAISKHLRVLERAGLISRGRDAQRRPRRLEVRPLAEATEWLEGYRQFWEGRFQRLDALLDTLKAPKKKRGHSQRSVDVAATRSTHSQARRSRLGSPAPTKRTGDRQ